MWDRIGATQTLCFRLSGLAAHHCHHSSHWGGFHPGSSSVRKSHLHSARAIHVSTRVTSCCPHGDAVNGELVGDLLGGSSGCPVGVLFLRHWHTLDCLCFVAWWKVGLQDVGAEPGVSTSPLSPSSHFPFSPPLPSPGCWGCSSSRVRRR